MAKKNRHEDSDLLGCYAVQICDNLPTFRRSVLSYSGSCSSVLKMKALRSYETSVFSWQTVISLTS